MTHTASRWGRGLLGLAAVLAAGSATACMSDTPPPAGSVNITSVSKCAPNEAGNGYLGTVTVANDGERLSGPISLSAGGKDLEKTYPAFPAKGGSARGTLVFASVPVPQRGETELVAKWDGSPIARASVSYYTDPDDPSIHLCKLTQLPR